jgi:Nif-specific regulatory protein
MHSVIISKDSQFIQVVPLGGKATIGRNPGNDIVLDAAGVSRNHASILRQDDQFLLVDQGSTNGTYVEDKPVRRHPLVNGTSFRIQNYLLTFVKEASSQQVPLEDLATATLMESASEQHLKTLWVTQVPTCRSGLQQKVARLLKMMDDLNNTPGGPEASAIVLDALVDITGAMRGAVAMKQKDADPLFSYMRGFDHRGQRAAVSRTIFKNVLDTGTIVYLNCADKEAPTDSVSALHLKSVLCAPLTVNGSTIGCIYLDHPEHSGAFSNTDRDLLIAALNHVAEVFVPKKRLTTSLSNEDERLAAELKQRGVIALSPKTVKVFRDTKTIARYSVSVLIFGETGTGKELIARYIHDQSGRKGKFIARNCSAIAASMFESELFGHEKGAFTGATEQKQGILEMADQGTLFLDEIGDMPAAMQAKMLRALQEQEVWRVGGTAPVKIDVRIIAATHKDIKAKRKQLNFRDDLYYRLANVEITSPSLRERPEDIAPLCEMILDRFAKDQMDGQKPFTISQKALRLLEAYDWPGNIRELRNMLIQASLRSTKSSIDTHHLKGLVDVFSSATSRLDSPLPSLQEVERDHILKALKCTNWNKSAAAKILSIDRNRLNRRLKKLDIEAP